MILTMLAGLGVVCAAIPTVTFLINRDLFRPPQTVEKKSCPAIAADLGQAADNGRRPEASAYGSREQLLRSVSVLIPARNEAKGIEAAIRLALASEGFELEVVVLDDNSEDNTAAIVQTIANEDSRVRLLCGNSLPHDWNGKQHACYQLAQAARYSRLVFIDADVRLQPDALERLIDYQDRTKVALLSAFPHQVTGSWLEKWLIPLMHFILLGFLPFWRMRRSTKPAYAAGCGQLFLTSREQYELAGTHAAIRGSRHDGLKLPRAYRSAGLMTDVIDGTPLAECRMYSSASEVIQGLLKNAIEGIANPKLIVPFTIIMICGTILPLTTAMIAIFNHNALAVCLSLTGILVSHLPRAIAAQQFRQSWQGVIFHIPSIAIFIAIQWQALFNHLVGRSIKWRGRS